MEEEQVMDTQHKDLQEAYARAIAAADTKYARRQEKNRRQHMLAGRVALEKYNAIMARHLGMTRTYAVAELATAV